MDENSQKILKNVHPKQRELVTRLIDIMIAAGYDARVTQGLRTFAEQESLYAQGRTKPGNRVTNARGGQSNHNYGLANDITIFKNSKPDWNDLTPYRLLGREAKKLGLEWGGDWKAVDMPHVQLKGMSVKECQTFYNRGGLTAVWDRMNQILGGAKPIVFIPKEEELLEFGDKGAAIGKLQADLVKLGFLRDYEIDEEFGKVTKNAVTGFQRQYGLTANGIVGPGTKARIKSALEAKLAISEILPSPENVSPAVEKPPTLEDSAKSEPPPADKPLETPPATQAVQVPQVSAETEPAKEVSGIKASIAGAVTFITTSCMGILTWLGGVAWQIVAVLAAAAIIVGIIYLINRFWFANKEKQREHELKKEREKQAFELQKLTLESAMRRDLNTVQIVPTPIENSEAQ